MVKESTKAPVNSIDSSEQEPLEKIRWSLRQRLCEHMRHLITDLFDELDDFLFCSVQPEELGEGSVQLKLIREFRNKKQLFEEQFLSSIDGALQSTLVPKNAGNTIGAGHNQDKLSSSAIEKMEVDLALERMQRKAFKHYAPRIRQLGSSDKGSAQQGTDPILPENRDILIKNSLRALADSHRVFRVSLEHRLVFLKLFEKHLLFNMDKLYQDVISIINNKDNQQFVERLYSSSTSIHERREKSKISQPESASSVQPTGESLSGSKKISARIDELLEGWCDGSDLPEFVETMLRNEWHGVMFLMGLNKGLETREWCEAKETIDLMLQLLAGESSAVGEQIGFDQLCHRLLEGFELAQKPKQEQQEFIAALEQKVSQDGRGKAKDESTSMISSNNGNQVAKAKPGNYAAVSEAGRKILDNSDLDDFVALLSDDQEQAIAELDEEAISMDYYLNMVDTMADGATADVKNFNNEGKCRIEKSTSIADSYQVLDEKGRVLLTRGRVGLAVSLRAGEIRLEGQQDFNQAQISKSQLIAPENASGAGPATTH